MQMISLATQARDKAQTPRALRRAELVPCVLYGNSVENLQLQCNHKELLKAYTQAGESTLVELDANGKKVPVLFHAIAFGPVSDRIIHVDFYAVNMKKEIEAHIPVHFTGESPAVKDLGAVLVTSMDHLWVRCLPADLPHELTADVSSLKEFGDHLTVAAVQVPDRVKIEEELTSVIASVQEPRRIEEETPAPAEGEVPAEGAEGAPAAEGAEAGADAKAEKKEKKE
jgi:large subunit ribosomal protein L25